MNMMFSLKKMKEIPYERLMAQLFKEKKKNMFF